MESKYLSTHTSTTRRKASVGALRFAVSLAMLISMGLFASQAQAIGVAAGTDITNTASASYEVGGTPVTETSPPVVVTVEEIIDVTVVEQNSPVNVAPSDTNRVLTFLVTNTGNGEEVFDLTVLSNLGTDDFDPSFVSVYFDTNLSGVYDAGDTISSGFTPNLDANGVDSITVFVLHDIPDNTFVSDGDVGAIDLEAESQTLTGAPGDSLGGAGDLGTTAVVGLTGGDDNDEGEYIVSSVAVDVDKSFVILNDPTFGMLAVPGATIRYTIVVTVTGSGTADNLVITDGIPIDTIYAGGTLTLGGVTQTDLSDLVDGGEHDAGAGVNGEISVDLGNVAGGSPAQTITFDAQIDPS